MHMVFIFAILELLIWIYIFNRDRLFGMMFFMLLIYSNMPVFARLLDNNLVNRISHVTISNKGIIAEYSVYSLLFMIFLFLYWTIFRIASNRSLIIKIPVYSFSYQWRYLYYFIHIVLSVYLCALYIINSKYMSYESQSVVKSNIIWFILLEYVFVFVYIDIFIYKRLNNNSCLLILPLTMLIPSILTCLKIGNRAIFFGSMLGILYIVLEKMNVMVRVGQLKRVIKPLLLVVFIILGSQVVRYNRGGFQEFRLSTNMVTDLLNLRILLFQDYTYPGNSLMYLLKENVVEPSFVLISNFNNSLFFLDGPTIASHLSNDYIAPGQWFGIGGFIVTEAYLFASWLGIIIVPFFIAVGYYIFNQFINSVNNKHLKLFIGFLITSFVSLNIVRGQTYILFKSIYMYFIPSILLFKLAYSE